MLRNHGLRESGEQRRGEERRGRRKREERRRARWTSSLCERAFIFYLTSSHPLFAVSSLSPVRSLSLSFSLALWLSLSLSFFSFRPVFLPLPHFFHPPRPLSRVSTASAPRVSSPALFAFPPSWNPFDFPLSSRRSPRAKIKREGGGGSEGERE